MSFSVSIPATSKDRIVTDLQEAKTDAIGRMAEEFQGASGDMFDQIANALPALLSALGRDGDHVSVTISGHANPGHAPKDGWSNESLSLSFGVIPQEAPTPDFTDEVDAPEALTGDGGQSGTEQIASPPATADETSGAEAGTAGAPPANEPPVEPAGDGTPVQ